MHVSFEHCGQIERCGLAEQPIQHGPLRCRHCGTLISTIDVTGTRSWIDAQAARKRALSDSGQLATRKQSTQQSDEEIDLDGLSAELAACALLCPRSLDSWRKAAESLKSNRGRDLLRRWTGLNKPVEVKHTRYHDAERGFLLVRPPRQTPGRMREEYIDDAYYLLMVGRPYQHAMVGWIDRDGLIRDGGLNPVPIQPGQRECWGMHWSRLRPVDELVENAWRGGPLGAVVRWLLDLGCG
ncbi:MAG: hypothetical protein H6821_10615 [Planctomycetaceae bacterium]|nr:hypothetical protein [Planctomycetaceae bacterium]MCB9936958.1 hypothetical protein [Planctomycetaceae bacterium]HRX78613.1 hypothetical protein [Pirellulaceae bacterium]